MSIISNFVQNIEFDGLILALRLADVCGNGAPVLLLVQLPPALPTLHALVALPFVLAILSVLRGRRPGSVRLAVVLDWHAVGTYDSSGRRVPSPLVPVRVPHGRTSRTP